MAVALRVPSGRGELGALGVVVRQPVPGAGSGLRLGRVVGLVTPPTVRRFSSLASLGALPQMELLRRGVVRRLPQLVCVCLPARQIRLDVREGILEVAQLLFEVVGPRVLGRRRLLLGNLLIRRRSAVGVVLRCHFFFWLLRIRLLSLAACPLTVRCPCATPSALVEQVGQSQLRCVVGVGVLIGWRGGLQQARRADDLVRVSFVVSQLRIDGLCSGCV